MSLEAPNAIRGWLLVFAITRVLGIAISVPMTGFSFYSALTGSTTLPADDASAFVVITLLYFSLSIVGTVLLFLRNRVSPLFWTVALPILAVCAFANGVINTPTDAPPLSPALSAGARDAILSFGWAVYWMTSRRVKAVFGSRGIGVLFTKRTNVFSA